MDSKEIFRIVMGNSILEEVDRELLKKKRGFSDEVIDKLQLRSITEPFMQKMEELGVPEDVRVCFYGAWNETAAGKNILIPYFHPDGEVYHIRPHKFGITGFGAHAFIPYQFLGEDTSRLVLAESEFKAVASCVMGVPAIGVPGINVYSKEKFPELIDILNGLKCKEVVICFDNEEKGNPEFKNFKLDYTKRYDTLIYEFVMATKIEKQGIKTRIARLKDSWRVEGKADIDGALAQGRSYSDYKYLIDHPMEPWRYRGTWKMPEKHKAFVERKIDSKLYNGVIEEKFKSYWQNAGKKFKLSNFTIKIAYTLFGSEGAERYCRLESAYGNSKSVIVTPEIMVSKSAFQKFCYELGDYEFMGDEKDLGKIWNYVLLHQDGKAIQKLDFFGYHDEAGVWFFSNGAYFHDKFYPVDDDGIVWVEDEGYMLPHKSEEEKDITEPVLCSEPNGITVSEIYNRFSKVIEPSFAKMILGWALSNFFMPEILKEWKVFPFLFFYGKQQAGKSTLSNWISSFFGFTQKGIPFSSSTLPALSRVASKLSMVPLWFEEYRQRDPNLANKNNFLRNVYDKSTRIIAKRGSTDVIGYKPRAALIISGEESPQDAALNSRCIMIPVFRGELSPEDFSWMQDKAPLFNSIGHQILTNKEHYWTQIKKRINEYLETFERDLPHTDSRSRLHNSIVAGTCDVFMGSDSQFIAFIGQHTEDRSRHVDTSQALYVFYEDVLNLWGTKKIDFDFIKLLPETPKGHSQKVAFWFQGAYSFWESQYKNMRTDIPASKTALMEHMKREPYFVAREYARIGKKSLSCFVLDYDHKEFPELLKNIIVGQQEEENMPSNTFNTKPIINQKPVFGMRANEK